MARTCAAIETPLQRLNVADRLTRIAAEMPDTVAVACPRHWSPGYTLARRGASGASYATTTFAELDADVTRLALGLARWGVPPGTRLALLVRPGIEFVTLVFALLRAGMVTILVDPGLGRRNLVRCLAEAKPEGFVAIGAAQAVRAFLRRKFAHARWNVTVGRRWFWGGLRLEQLRAMGSTTGFASAVGRAQPTNNRTTTTMVGGAHPTKADDPAAIIFTSGSTGPPKGVLYTHRMFETQVSEIQSMYGIEPGGVDLSCFPLFALFNSAMGVTTVLPEMDFSRPAKAESEKLLPAANDWQVTQAFASPAVWRIVGQHCAKTGERIESLRQVFSCGAPVPAEVLRKTLACVAPGARMHTPYGATECLPISTIEAAEVLGEAAIKTDQGAGVCVGRKFDSIDWRLIRITDDPVKTMDDAVELPIGEIGELIVRGPQVSPCYVTRTEANASSKIAAPRAYSEFGIADSKAQSESQNPQSANAAWHRTGDVGYLDAEGRFWYCGRKSQRVETQDGPLFTECVEAVFNRHPDVVRTVLVGLSSNGYQSPVLFYQLHIEFARPQSEMAMELFGLGQQFPQTRSVRLFAEFDSIPVDIRHNAKILREEMAEWAKELELTEVDESTRTSKRIA
ncbi:MAG TPA: fatty acid CoA ligase family protein [Lacipirellulaceae bacterium]|nr:fatty acid CoA ligase family protein [Lacipirellulaceae bacterium]